MLLYALSTDMSPKLVDPSAASGIFDLLPGARMPFSEVVSTLSHLWSTHKRPGEGGVGEYHASHMNLVVHLGLQTTAKEAVEIFTTMANFSQRYPCRVIMLCPNEEALGEKKLEGKVFAQCSIGGEKTSISCCEILILGYSEHNSAVLEDHCSICLAADLPTYCWFHRVPSARVEEFYLASLQNFWGIVYDSSLAAQNYENIPWPQPHVVRDLADFKILPVKKAMGQFLSAFSPQQLVVGLQEVKVTHSSDIYGEGNHLLAWQQSCLESCCRLIDAEKSNIEYNLASQPEGSLTYLQTEWQFSNEKSFKWSLSHDSMVAQLEACLAGEAISHFQHMRFQSPEVVLASAFFF